MKRCSLDYSKAKPCDICGDKGVIEAIITCCECKTSRQHLYCMRVVTTEAPPFWICEECERRKLFSPTESDKDQKPEVLTPKVSSLIPKNTRVLKCPNKGVSASRFSFKEKRVHTGRTKYLSCDEAVKLSSGANQSPSKNASISKHGSSRSMAPPREKSLAKIYGATAATKFEPPLQQPIVQKSTAVEEKSDALSPRNKGDATEFIKFTKSSGRVERTNTESFSPRSEFLSPRNKGDAIESIKSAKSSGRVERTNTESFSPRSEALSPRNRGDATESVMSTKSSGRVDKTNTESFSPRSEVLPPTKEAGIGKHIEVPKSSKELEKTITQESTKMAESEALAATKEEAVIGKHIQVPKFSKELENIITQESRKMAESEALVAIKEEADIEVPKFLEKLENTDVKAGGKKNHANVEDESSEPNLIMGGPISEMHDTSIPALHSYWKGSFNLPNEHENLNGAFKAHPPSRVHCKVYETIHKMPENINFELVPIHEVWVDLFQGDCPYKDDIGLYFFPRFKERYDEKCTSLIDFLWSKNLVMKSFVDKVELFVFSSRYLQLHSQQFEGNYFLWGVFRSNKVKKGTLSKSKSIVVHDFPPGFEKIQKPPPRG